RSPGRWWRRRSTRSRSAAATRPSAPWSSTSRASGSGSREEPDRRRRRSPRLRAGSAVVSGRMAWDAPETVWPYDLLDRLPPGIDKSKLAETLRLSPEERIERLQRLMEFVDEVRLACGHRPAQAD